MLLVGAAVLYFCLLLLRVCRCTCCRCRGCCPTSEPYQLLNLDAPILLSSVAELDQKIMIKEEGMEEDQAYEATEEFFNVLFHHLVASS